MIIACIIVTADQREGNEGKYRVGFSATPEYDPDDILINPGSATVEEVRTALTGLNDGSLVVGEKGLERAQTSKNAPVSDGGVKIEQTPAETINEAQRVDFEGEAVPNDSTRHALIGVAPDGKKIYQSNFPQGTPKAAKSKRILDYIQNVWSKEPIRLVISNGETSRTILAQFDPTVDENQNIPTDASKLAGGNRHGNHTEQRVTLDLADDYYQIASESKYNYSKLETGKDLDTHKDVKMWHYFVNDIYFAEYGKTELTPYMVTINVKEKADGNFVYSFNAEKESSTRRTLHAGVNTHKGANVELFLDNSISQNQEKSTPSGENVSENVSDNAPEGASDNDSKRSALPKTREAKERKRKRAQEHQRQSREKRKAERMAEAMREEVVRNAEQNAEVNAEQGTEAAQETVEKAKTPRADIPMRRRTMRVRS